MEAYVIFWLAMIIFFIVLELLTIGLTSIWFAAGSIGGTYCECTRWKCIYTGRQFLIVSVVLLCLTKPWAKEIHKLQSKKDKCG